MHVIVFVPGYLTSKTCSSAGDTYVDLHTHASKHGFEFIYIPMPNNNYGDLGNVTIDDCVDYVLSRYNTICDTRHVSDTIILAGHSMGGMIISRLLTSTFSQKLRRLPDFVRLINPAISPDTTIPQSVLSTLLAFVPHSLQGLAAFPLPVAERNTLYPGSPPYSPMVKPVLVL